ncbi:hypothetical protein predicted by Glimmer/Critica [Acetobacter ghanensis]|uniref:Uncharacterized protein n=1 Tax=Acetobacter ghanensis TaxID=431306 RepID=A0A0U5EZ74_9PROT|nr:hypothetical protein predicted by Glimmer/Critica [Acetobacter ghanensis]
MAKCRRSSPLLSATCPVCPYNVARNPACAPIGVRMAEHLPGV